MQSVSFVARTLVGSICVVAILGACIRCTAFAFIDIYERSSSVCIRSDAGEGVEGVDGSHPSCTFLGGGNGWGGG